MSLIEQLKHFDAALRFELHVPKQSRLAKTAHRIEGLVDTLPAAPKHIPQVLIDEALAALHARSTPTLSNRNLRVFCIAGLNSLLPLDDPLEYAKQLTKEISRRTKSSLYRALLSGYLLIADMDFSWVKLIRTFLKNNEKQLPKKWIRRCHEFGLLDDVPCEKLAKLFWNENLIFDVQLEQAGITGALRTTGIGKQLLQQLCTDLSRSTWLFESSSELLLERFFEFINKNDELSFTGLANQKLIVHALLQPCLDQQPDFVIQKQIERFLLSAYSDPRVNPGKWGHIPQDLIQVFNRWLTKQAMGLLLEVLNRTADDHHWDSRNEFWGFYLDNDYVEEAWVVFGPEPLRHARDLVVSNSDFSAGSFGAFKRGGGQVQANHSVLLMRIDNVVIAEWTHNGRVRLWERGTGTSPILYRQSYFADILRGSGIKHKPQAEFTHDMYGHWKDKVDSFIHEQTGIKHGNITKRPTVRPKRQNVGGYPGSKPKIRIPAGDGVRSDPFKGISSPAKSKSEPYDKLPATGTCKGCGKTKPAKEFYTSKRKPGQLTAFCKQCSRKSR